jgi:CheY-like chemotaxis protein
MDAEQSGGNTPPLALMIEWGMEAYIPKTRFVSLPVQSISIANILNNKQDDKDYSENSYVSGIIRYSFPGARILVVDDIQTNLKVAEGLLAPYRVVVDTCLGGYEAVELVKKNDYDIIFMDHMMPDMDGIEATACIRDWERDRANKEEDFKPAIIIALTANAVSGVHEMFVEKGFNDFLAKPIDISKLDDTLNRWISRSKREHGSGKKGPGKQDFKIRPIKGADIQKGIRLTGGTEDGYILVLSTFSKDAQERIGQLRTTAEAADKSLFVTNVHAIKSASASIGADEVSVEAAKLEQAGKNADVAYIKDNLDSFIEKLSKLVDGINAAIDTDKKAEVKSGSSGDNKKLFLMLGELEEALKIRKADTIDRILSDILNQPLDDGFREAVEKISDDVLVTEFDNAAKKVKDLLYAKP